MRNFKKISFERFEKDVNSNKNTYDQIQLPKRSTKYSAGYDFIAFDEYVIKPNEVVKIPTGIKAQMNNDEVLFMVVRSSMGFKYNVRMCNQIGVIDCDYYNNPNNEGHIWIKLQNQGKEDYIIKKNDKYAQGIFMKYLIVDNEEEIKNNRIGGSGSTDLKEE